MSGNVHNAIHSHDVDDEIPFSAIQEELVVSFHLHSIQVESALIWIKLAFRLHVT